MSQKIAESELDSNVCTCYIDAMNAFSLSLSLSLAQYLGHGGDELLLNKRMSE